MLVLIAKANEDILTDLLKQIKVKKIEFKECTENTSTFNISEKKFAELRTKAIEAGYNPFALMSA